MDVLRKSCKYFCTAYLADVGNNTCTYSSCSCCVHRKRSSISGRLVLDPNGLLLTEVVCGVVIRGGCLHLLPPDTLSSGGRCKLAIIAHYQITWKSFTASVYPHSPCLPAKTRSHVHNACIHNTMLYASETWALLTEEFNCLGLNDRTMIWWGWGQVRLASQEGRLWVTSLQLETMWSWPCSVQQGEPVPQGLWVECIRGRG